MALAGLMFGAAAGNWIATGGNPNMLVTGGMLILGGQGAAAAAAGGAAYSALGCT
jgi:hypothetical protein